MILLYSRPSNRIKYTFKLVFEGILGVALEWTNDISFFKNATVPKLSYGHQAVGEEMWFGAVDFLFEHPLKNEIKKQPKKQPISVTEWNGLPVFFQHSKEGSALNFDPFAMIFYLVSRYEEYFSDEKDQHGRFPAKASLAFQHGFLERPLVDELAFLIKNIIQKRYPNFSFPAPSFTFTPTYDIDYAWSYLHKGWRRSIGGAARDLMKNQRNFIQRCQVIFGKKDPYFTFDYLDELHQKSHLEPIYFFLVGEHGAYDKNISIQKKPFQQLIQGISKKYPIGLHPSYQSNADFSILKKENDNLSQVTGKSIIRSRQHFLKLSFPNTYQNLIKLGIQEDYTMGYAEKVGFRASIARPFYWFDLEKNKATSLKVFPFQLMDVTLKNYLKLSPKEAIEVSKHIIEQTKKVNGHFISIWHNNSFCEQEGWDGWRKVYEWAVLQ